MVAAYSFVFRIFVTKILNYEIGINEKDSIICGFSVDGTFSNGTNG